MDGTALRRFKLPTRGKPPKTYEAGAAVSLPDAQFADLEAVGLVSPAKEKVKRAATSKTELPNPGNEPSNHGAEE